MKLTVLDDYQGVVPTLEAVDELAGLPVDLQVVTRRIERAEALVEALADTDAVVLIRERTRITARILAALPRLKLIVQTGRLSGAIDLEACHRLGVAVRDGSGNSIAPAEMTWALILAASRRVVPYHDELARGHWQRSSATLSGERLGRSLHGLTLGVWSLGKIGSRVAAIGRAFGMRILVHGRDQSRTAADEAGHVYVADRRKFLGDVDVLSLHLRFTPETRDLIGPDDLAAMRPDALLVNTSRAELIQPGALLSALDRGHPGYAALDVFENEPEGVAPYLAHPNVLCTPHLGFVERETYEAYFRQAFTHVRVFLSGPPSS